MSGSSNNPHTRAIAQFVSALRYEDVPPEVVARIKLLMLDSLGCALYGVDLEWSRILRTRLGSLDTTKACRVWGTAERLSAPHAALANGTLIQSFELDDVHRQGVLHVGAVTLPPLVAITELRPGLSGRDSPRRSPATRSVRASANAWARSISAKAGTPARRSECFRRRPALLARSASPPTRRCTRSALPARNPQA
jgi:2-methylcitrate dehydratase PrpD